MFDVHKLETLLLLSCRARILLCSLFFFHVSRLIVLLKSALTDISNGSYLFRTSIALNFSRDISGDNDPLVYWPIISPMPKPTLHVNVIEPSKTIACGSEANNFFRIASVVLRNLKRHCFA
ncbi:uncharacterized protein F4812DRAFT_281753 [Daldinia caldariorum]|uniref:uncharacterized protein n=1 Tax=Daldinia caldariorum TaxID=326644 RepID=UPI00200773FB|nr:uncharacterized protein F4812DRAFT_281753 [Daldinia caldariorum]KAI1470873.1 hypothetical protein F4812DRAFT_281753 [Daldinia caldariorum]